MNEKILVLGATGKTGKRVAQRLHNLNILYRTGSRNANPSFDWDKPNGWGDVLRDIQKVYITFQPDVAVPEAISKIEAFTEAAKMAGIKKLVLLSGRGEPEAQACEEVIRGSGADWTIVRASWFMQNFSENFWLDSVLSGQAILPKINALEPFVDLDDLADVVVAALTSDLHTNKTYELTGPELLSFMQAFATISHAINQPIEYQEISIDEYASVLRTHQLPEDHIWLIKYLFAEILDGRNEALSDDIQKVLGRNPTTFARYVEKTVKAGVWNSEMVIR